MKRYGGEAVGIGEILIRQKGTKFNPGRGTKLGNDYTIFAVQEGKVNFKIKLGKKVVEVI